MEKVVYSGNCGQGIICENDEQIEGLKSINVTVIGQTIKVGDMTTLFGYFNSPVMFCGVLENGANYDLIFFLGNGSGDLFTAPKKYYQLVALITETKLFTMYSYKGGRDLNWNEKLKKWK